jgi:hypothetical protein
MARTTVRSDQILDSTVNRDDLNTATTTKAVIAKVIAGTNITIGSTGVDPGTGDVTINASGGGGLSIVTTDPVSPNNGDQWILDKFSSGAAMGALGMTYNGYYLLSIKTANGIRRIFINNI